MSGSQDLNTRLKQAVRSVEPPPFLEARILNHIRAQGAAPRKKWALLIPVAAAAIAVASLGISYELGHLRMTATSQESYIASVSTRVATLMRVGLGDHIHCSVFRKFPQNPPAAAEFVKTLGPKYAGLAPLVQDHVPGTYRLMMAHQCGYNGRRFVHLSLLGDDHLLSLVIARKAPGESFETEGLLPALVQSGIPIYQSGVQRFAINAFENGDHLVYFISDLPAQQNAEILQAMAPVVKQYLETL